MIWFVFVKYHSHTDLSFRIFVSICRVISLDNSRYGSGYGATGTLVHIWWKCKMVQPLRKRVWQFLIMYFPKRKENICPPKDLLENVLNKFIHNSAKLRTTPDSSPGQGVNELCFTHVTDYYSKIKSNQLLIQQHGWISKAWYQVKKQARCKRIYTIWFYLYETLKKKIYSGARNQISSCLGPRVIVDIVWEGEQETF